MFEQLPGSPALVALLAIVPAVLRWFWGRSLRPLIDDPVLPERLAAHGRRVRAAWAVSFALILVGWPSAIPWAAPLLIVLQLAAGYPFRKFLYQETWGFAGYASFFGRLLAATFGFWIVLAATPALSSRAGRFDWLAALGLAAGLAAWNRNQAELLRRMLRTQPIADGPLVERFHALVNKAGVPVPRFELVAMHGGVVANAVALPSLRQSSVIFTDTLLSRLTADEIIAIAAHEIAHLEYYDRARLRRMTTANSALIAVSAGLAPLLRLAAGSHQAGAATLACFLAILVVLVGRAKHRQKNETASDVRAVALTGDGEALVRGLTTLHAIARVPRRWDQQRERQATHPSLARRIHDIRAAAGVTAAPLEGPFVVRAADGPIAVTFEDGRLAWQEGEGTIHLLDYGTLVELRLHAKSAAAAMRLVAKEKGGRRWEMTPNAADLPELQALLDRVDGKLSHEAPPPQAFAFAPSLPRLLALLAITLGASVGQLATGLVALIATLVPTQALINAAAIASMTSAAVVLRDDRLREWSDGAAALLFVLGVALLILGRARRADTSRAEGPLVWALAICAALATAAIGLGGLNPIRLHQGARALPAAAVLLSAVAAACFTRRKRPVMRYAAATAACAGAIVAAIGSTTFLDRAGRDPFLVAAAPVTWRSVDVPVTSEFDVPFMARSLRLSPRGRLVAIQQTAGYGRDREITAPRLHAGPIGGPLTPLEATDLAFIDDRRALLLVLRGGSAEVQEAVLGSQIAIRWRQPIENVRWAAADEEFAAQTIACSIAFERASGRWTVTGRDVDGRLVRASGVVGQAGVESLTWNATPPGAWMETFGVRGGDAFVVERRVPYDVDEGVTASTFVALLLGPHTSTQLWRLHAGERIDAGRSLLDAQCDRDVLEDGRIACTVFDGTRTRFAAIDPLSGAVAPIATIDGRFVKTGVAAPGWLTGWTDSRPTAVNLSTHEAIRAPSPAGGYVQIVTAADEVIGTLGWIKGGARVRIYPLQGTAAASARID